MKIEMEGGAAIESPSEAQIKRVLSSLRSYGPTSFASLTAGDGSYLQVAGGGGTCMMEHRLPNGVHYRAYHSSNSSVFADGTVLSFGGGDIAMRSDEWLTTKEVEAAFLAFLNGQNLPPELMWRNITHVFD